MSAQSKKPHLLIIGGGSAAFSAAIHAHGEGARVTIVNDGLPVGGTCVNVGCVPSKTLLRAAEAHHHGKRNRFAGIEGDSRLTDFRQVMEQKRELVEMLRQEKYRNVVDPLEGVEIIERRGRFVASGKVEVGGESMEADAVLIATGASSSIPAISGLENVDYLTNESAFELQELPESMAVIGGNYIGLEMAQLFARLGSEVTVVELESQILPRETSDVADELTHHLSAEGLTIRTGAKTVAVSTTEKGVLLQMEVGGETEELEVERVLVAAGRKPNTENMGLEEAGIEVDEKGFIVVDSYMKTTADGIYAAGDVTGDPMFVYTAAYEGKLAVRNALEKTKISVDYHPLPWVVFTDPQVAGVGMNEREAAKEGFTPDTTTLPLAEVPRAIAARDTRGFIKLIRDKDTDRLLGGRIVAPEGSELLMELAMAIKHEMTIQDLTDTLHPYLTLSEGIRLAALIFRMSAKSLSCCAG